VYFGAYCRHDYRHDEKTEPTYVLETAALSLSRRKLDFELLKRGIGYIRAGKGGVRHMRARSKY
jgi:hypothetical protein